MSSLKPSQSLDPCPTHRSPVYQWQEDVENLERYRVGGYHPVRIGDEYSQGRYRIVHKLGLGVILHGLACTRLTI